VGAGAAAVSQATARARTELSGRILAVTLRAVRDPDIAEEATADAFVAALETWPQTGIPDSVEAWLVTVARRKALDRIRRDQLARRMATRLADRIPQVAAPADARIEAGVIGDEELRLTVLCADPRLPESDQVALTLRWACGVSTTAIAAAHLVSVPTMAARLTRARKKLMAAGPQLDLPDDATVDARLPLVCRIVQLAYTLGHTAADGADLTDEDLAGRAVHLARTLHRQRPTDPEITGLLALVLLGQGRAAGRIGPDGRQLLLTDVDRSTWDANLITEGLATSELALAQGIAAGRAPGAIALQAAISAAHSRAPTFGETDWKLVVELYGMLLTVEPNPTLALGRCVAVSYLSGPEAGLADLDGVLALGGLDGYPYAHAARAQLLDRAGRPADAAAAWTAAADRARSSAERAWFVDRGAASRVSVGRR
jgi:RNA polymerase sigma-70 factor (ECF subfamily)